MNRLFCILIMGLMWQLSFADRIPTNPRALPPPPPTMPQAGTNYISGNDVKTQSGPTSQMNTITTQSTGTSGNYIPQSHPIPLDNSPDR
jgi:hypothetical protein